MNKFESNSRFPTWFMALLLTAFVAGCGSGGGKDPILGTGGTAPAAPIIVPGAPPGAVPPGACVPPAAAPLTIPTVTASDPSNGNLLATTSTGAPGANKLITATFSLDMLASSITSTTFTLTELTPAGAVVALVPSIGQPAYNAATRVATLTVAALKPATRYTAIIAQGAVTTPGGIGIVCTFAWNFTTGAVSAGAAPVNLGLASPFGISATAGMTVPGGFSTVNGDVLLMNPTATCGGAAAPANGVVIVCPPFVPTINGLMYSANFDPGGLLANYRAAITAAYISIAPPGGQGGTLAGGVDLPCGIIGTAGGCPGPSSTLAPGVYIAFIDSIGVSGNLTLDGGGDQNARFIFQTKTPSTLTTAPGSTIILTNGTKASNVFWQVGSSATINGATTFQGNILASADITLNGGVTACGRMLAGEAAGAIVLGGAVVSVPGNVNAPAGCQ